MDPKFEDQLAHLGDLGDDELEQLHSDLIDEFDKASDDDDIPSMEAYHDAIKRVGETQTARQQESEANAARAEELRNSIHPAEDAEDGESGDADEDDAEGEGDDDADDGDDEEEDPTRPPASAEDEAPAIAASANGRAKAKPAPSLGAANKRVTAARRQAASATTRTGMSQAKMYAQRPVGAIQTGDVVPDQKTLAQMMTSVIDRLGRGDGEQRLVASTRWDYPEERSLTADIEANTRKIDAVVSPQAIVASGGICGPVDVDFSMGLILSADDEPLGDSLPTFGAKRGGLRYPQTPTFSGVGNSSIGVWTEATDASPGGSTKPVQTFVCGNEEEVFVDAITVRMKFGNMQGRFNPEMVQGNTALALSNAARVRELTRLSKIAAQSTTVSSGQLLGAARDFLATLDQASAAYRYRSRVNRGVQMRAVLPDFLRDMIRADLLREMAHGQDISDTFTLTDAQVDGLLKARGFSPVWMLDGQAAATHNGVAFAAQGFGSQSQGAALLDWPHNVVWYLYAEGTFQRLDGGQLDLGVVRDSVLDSTNDYETFVENFEAVAMRGFESLEIVSALRPNGLSAGTANTSTY